MKSRFFQELLTIGSNDLERAQRLGVSQRTITRYRRGILPPPIRNLMRYPSLLRALAEDSENNQREA